MGKPKNIPVPNPESDSANGRRQRHGNPEPLSGSKKTKQINHVSQHNPEG